MSTQTLITVSPDELSAIIRQAVRAELAEIRLAEEPVSKEAFKALAGYKDEPAFRAFCKANNIQPVEIRARKYYYLPSQLSGIQRPKGVHLTKA